MKIYSVSTKMFPFFQKVCLRDSIKYQMVGTNEKGYSVSLDCSNHEFKTIIEDCMCLIEQEKNYCKIPVYSFRTLTNPKKKERLMKLNNKRCFFVLRKDIGKYLQYTN